MFKRTWMVTCCAWGLMLACSPPFAGDDDDKKEDPGGARAVTRTDQEPAGSNCAQGGSRVSAGVDADRDGSLADGEVAVVRYACNPYTDTHGQSHPSSLVRVDQEPAGEHCSEGGLVMRSGADTDGNSTLSAQETADTVYICNGEGIPPSGSSSGASSSSSGASSSSGVVWTCPGGRVLAAGEHYGNTRATADRFSGCSLWDANDSLYTVGAGANDEPWFLHLDHRQRAQLTLTGFDTSMYLLQGLDCTTATLIASACINNDNGDTENLDVVLAPGDYWVIVDGNVSGTTRTQGEYTLDVMLSDPCRGVSPEGRCEDPSTLSWCTVPPAGIDNYMQATLTCLPSESCQTVQGVSRCLTKPGGTPCKPFERRCVNSTTIESCTTQGQFVQTPCPVKCVDEVWRAYCGEDIPVQAYSGTFQYQYRTMRPDWKDWDANPINAPVPEALVVSLKRSNDDWVFVASAMTDSEGHYTINVPSPPGPDDVVTLFAAAPRLRQGSYAFVVAQPDVGDGTVPTDVTSVKGIWSWSVNPAYAPSGSTVVVNLGQGAAVLRVFDAVRMTFNNLGEQYYHETEASSLAVWLRPGTAWECGACMRNRETPMEIAGQVFNQQMFMDGSDIDQGYWADSTIFHELGHWLMNSYGAPAVEGGTHFFGHAYFPGMGWSEGWAGWISAAARKNNLFLCKLDGFTYAYNLDLRKDTDGNAWPRPTAAGGLFQRIYDLEVATMLWKLGKNPNVTSDRLFRALALPRAKLPLRGYTRHSWDLDDEGEPINVEDLGEPTVMLADYLDALVCTNDPADIAAYVDAVTQPSVRYPYPSHQPICQ